MSSLNKAMLIGNLGKDPDVRYTQSNKAVATLSVATSEKFKDNNGEVQERTEWHRVVVWNKLAEICQQYLKKGSKVYIEGKIQTNAWEDKDGQKRYTTEILGLSMTMLDSRGGSGNGGSGSAPSNYGDSPQQQENPPIDIGADIDDDGDDSLPF
ncbi:MAG: single-stranded DNA-binding protein [Balneolales bacterium]